MKLYFVVQSCVGFQGSLRSTHRSLVCLHKANIELNVSWLSQLDPFRLLSLGAKRPPPPPTPIARDITWINVLPLFSQPPFTSHFQAYILPPALYAKKTSHGVHLFALRAALQYAESSHTGPNIVLEGFFSLRLFPPSPLSPTLCEAQWSVPKCASEGFLPHLTPARIHTQKIGMKIETPIN